MNRPTPAPLPRGDLKPVHATKLPSSEGLGVGSWCQFASDSRRFSLSILSAFLMGVVALGGCVKDPAPPQPIAVADAPESLQEAFKGAGPEVAQLVNDIVGALGKKNFGKASLALQSLSGRSDLTPDQLDLAARAMLSVNEALAEQANSGNEEAQKTLQFKRMTK
ncbi:MAG: hypothetical protein O2960_01805 [Verrucomicrobia bacterium]|nr:hypothetical protein [Verrucomicrobiota bacterium]